VVVVMGAGEKVAEEGIRLTRAAREGGSALVVVTASQAVAQLRVLTRLEPDRYGWRLDPFGERVEVESVCVSVEARTLGWSGRATLRLPVLERPRRMAPESVLPDRRGVRWRSVRKGGEFLRAGESRV
jgi:hypothetical protein